MLKCLTSTSQSVHKSATLGLYPLVVVWVQSVKLSVPTTDTVYVYASMVKFKQKISTWPWASPQQWLSMPC